MRRRDFIAAIGASAGWSLTARAQQRDRMRRIGVLLEGTETDPVEVASREAFEHELARSGWTIGQNVRIDYRWATGDNTLERRYAAELIALKPDATRTTTAPTTTTAAATMARIFMLSLACRGRSR